VLRVRWVAGRGSSETISIGDRCKEAAASIDTSGQLVHRANLSVRLRSRTRNVTKICLQNMTSGCRNPDLFPFCERYVICHAVAVVLGLDSQNHRLTVFCSGDTGS
jgi:hypothetical protein